MASSLENRVEEAPDCPGVYIFKDAKGKVLYVGKAKSIRSRLRSYFRDSSGLTPRARALMRKAADLEYIATRSEVEALILECNLIKHFKPRYNVNLKDDKKYPYIKVTIKDTFPSIYPTRDLTDTQSRYFGPYTDAKAMRKTLKVLTDVFPVRTCRRKLPLREPDRGCLKYFIGKCVGPCTGQVSPESYRRLVEEVCQYLSGRMGNLIKDLRRQMEEEASNLRFEQAARLRDRLSALEKIAERQSVILSSRVDKDIIAVRSAKAVAVAVVLKVREGKLLSKEVHKLKFSGDVSQKEILSSFLEQFIGMSTNLPQEILVELEVEGCEVLTEWLERKTGRRVTIRVPKSGRSKELVSMAAKNAELELSRICAVPGRERIASGIIELARWLPLPKLPVLIEAFDVSTTQGSEAVGSKVCFRNGRPLKSRYRRYQIKTVEGQDDFAMMKEIVRRRWERIVKGEEEVPDLLVIDGGKGQVSSAIEGLIDAGCDPNEVPPIIGIAKRLDEIYLPQASEPIQIPHTSPALRLIQKLRDEAHRFAIGYHRKLRSKRGMKTRLEDVKGIGPVLSRRLLERFGGFDSLREASLDEIATVKGMTVEKARQLIEFLKADTKGDRQGGHNISHS